MLIKALKSGLHAHPDPARLAEGFKAGTVVQVDKLMGEILIKNEWAAPVDLEKLTKADLVKLGAPADLSKQEMINALGLL